MSVLEPIRLFDAGYGASLIAVIPPRATLAPSSKIQANQLGKVPGRPLPNGTWAGYNWRAHEASRAEVEAWAQAGANIGLRAGRFPGVDIDTLDPELAAAVEFLVLGLLGPAPVRIGKPPKRLLMYRTDAPFTRMRAWIKRGETTHLIEVLGEGQQYLIHGTHPATLRPYEWVHGAPPEATQLTPITREQVLRFFAELGKDYELAHQEGDGLAAARTAAADQSTLRAPSIEALQRAVAAIPNTDERFPAREDYIKMAYAIRAAAGEDRAEDGFDVFAAWAASHAPDGRVAGNPDTWRADWRRVHGPYAVGWPWLAELARGYGVLDAPDDFTVVAEAPAAGPPPASASPARVRLSDHWLAREVVRRVGDRLRFVPATGQWLVWDAHRWRRDAMLLAQHEVGNALHAIAQDELTRAPGPAAARDARTIEGARRLFDVMRLVRADRTIAVDAAMLDADPWLLNTPAGVLDLRTGALSPASPDGMHTKSTTVAPSETDAPHWTAFLEQTTGGDAALRAYLQRLAGYCCTGLTVEQMIAFIWGPGGNGKSTFQNAVQEILGDYATIAAMDTFTASNFDKHTTDLADLMGARLVVASETQAGRRWDEQRVKQLSGGEPIKARFMRQDNFTYRPSFKLLFMGNHQPHVRDLDAALRRRVHMIPFTRTPPVVDLYLQDKIRAEYPAVFAWMVRGCLAWQQRGLEPAPAVFELTQEYFTDEDTVGRWLTERAERAPDGLEETGKLFQSWKEWCNEVGEYAGSQKRLAQVLRARGFAHVLAPGSRRACFRGLRLLPVVPFGEGA